MPKLKAALLSLVVVLSFVSAGAQAPLKFALIGEYKGFSYEVAPAKGTGTAKTGITRNVKLAEPNKGFYILTGWDVDCKLRRARPVLARVFTPSHEVVSSDDMPDSTYIEFDPTSFGGKAMTIWCGNRTDLKNMPSSKLLDAR